PRWTNTPCRCWSRPCAAMFIARNMARSISDLPSQSCPSSSSMRFSPATSSAVSPWARSKNNGLYRVNMRYGNFNDTQREYIITQPDTPLPWINYLGSEGYFGLISNTAGGYSFYQDARLRRLTRYRYNNAPLDSGGRYIYLRDENPLLSGPVYWSPTWQPTRTPLDSYECRHGMGYTVITSQKNGIEASTRYFVP